MTEVLLEVRDSVAHVTLNRPQATNALNLEMALALESAALKCEEDPNVRAVLMTGAGQLFCGGGDLKSFAAQPPEELPGHLKKVTMYLHTAIQRFAHRGDLG
jgi:2-(1,2-epoxy-1,2-dihydrophenyl)acetyl-CoA isomerase